MNKTSIAFMLDDQMVEIDFQVDIYNPNTTLLNFLRNLPTRKGTKEGCAEGDCGACTVVIASIDNGKLKYSACDSCLIFLPMIHGKQIITVESLKRNGLLHPVQKAMVDTDGSQCGYCTPGIVMTLFALYKNGQSGHDEIMDALTGNLCRCTGYRPIVEAAHQALSGINNDQANDAQEHTLDLLHKIREEYVELEIVTDSYAYYKPYTINTALKLRSDHPEAILVNGATDIGLMVTKQRKTLPSIIDISDVIELKSVEENDDSVEYGAGRSLESIKNISIDTFPELHKMLAVFGSRQIRELGSLGGNVANASPIGDTPPVLMAYDASVKLKSMRGERILNLHEFITGYRQTALKGDELIYSIIIPKNTMGCDIRSYKISKRKDLDISTVSGGFKLIKQGNTVKEIKLYYGGMAAMVKSAEQAESFLTGKDWSRANVEAAQDLIEQEFTPISDARSGAKARSTMARNLLLKFWSETSSN